MKGPQILISIPACEPSSMSCIPETAFYSLSIVEKVKRESGMRLKGAREEAEMHLSV